MQIDHFRSEYQHGPYKVKELVMNASVILADPKRMTIEDYAALREVTAAYAEESTQAKAGASIEWSGAAKRAAQRLDKLTIASSELGAHLSRIQIARGLPNGPEHIEERKPAPQAGANSGCRYCRARCRWS